MKKEKKNTIHAIPALLLSVTLSAAMLTVSCTQRNCRTAERQAVATARRDTTVTDTVQTAETAGSRNRHLHKTEQCGREAPV